MPSWSQVTVRPSPAALAALRTHWRWKLGDDWTLLLVSALGDVFVELAAGSVWWLSTATGSLELVADAREDFVALLEGEQADEWFLPGLVDVLLAQGKALGPEDCYTFTVLPVFQEGSYRAENVRVVSAAWHFAATGQLLERIRQLPDGTAVQLVIED